MRKTKAIIAILIIILIGSCKDKEPKLRKMNFIVAGKVEIVNNRGGIDYFLKSNDTILEVSTEQFVRYNLGDTLKLEILTEDFDFFNSKGKVFLNNKR